MTHVQVKTSPHGTPGEFVAVENCRVVWAGAIENIADAGSFDVLFCHDSDVQEAMTIARRLSPASSHAWAENDNLPYC